MKKLYFVALFSSFFFCLISQTGAPQKINYQGIARDAANGAVMASTNLTVGINISKIIPTNIIYSETHNVTTNAAGIFTLAIGNGLFPTAVFSNILWGGTPHFIEVILTTPLGGPFSMGVNELISVPYALYAEKAGNANITAGSGIAVASGTIINTAQDKTVTISNGINTNITSSYPNFTVDATPTLSIAGNTLSISGGNAVSLPIGASYSGSTGISVSGNTITNTMPNQTVTIANGTNVIVNGSYPNYTVNSTPNLSIAGSSLSISGGNTITLPAGAAYTASTAISISGNTITNTAPDKTVSITPGNSNVSVISSYPNFTVTSSPTLSLVANTLSISNGNSITLPLGSPSTTITSGNTNISIIGAAPNYTISNTPTLSIVAGTLSISNGNSVNLPLLPPPTSVTATGASTVAFAGQSFTVNSAIPTYSAIGTTSMIGSFPNYTVSTPAQTLTATNFTLTSTHGGSAMLPSYAAGLGMTLSGVYPTFTMSAITGTNPSWNILGNIGTVDGTHFIGTTDLSPFNIRVNNQKAGRIDLVSKNSFYGYQAGNLTTGTFNTAIGGLALFTNNGGSNNTAIGAQAINLSTTGNDNTALGFQASYSLTTGSFNVAVGNQALYSNTNGLNNTALGYTAGKNNVTGSGNVFLGHQAGFNELGSNKLYIANSNVGTPLIFGDFTTAKVGLGSISPAENLQVETNGNTQVSIVAGGTNSATLLFGKAANHALAKIDYDNVNNNLSMTGNGFANRLFFEFSGRVGVATNAPIADLDVNGNARLGGSKLFLGTMGGINSGYTGIYENVNDLRFAVFKAGGGVTPFGTANSMDAMIIKSGSGNVGIGTMVPSVNARLAISDGHIQTQQAIAPTIVGNNGNAASFWNVVATDIAGIINITTPAAPFNGAQATVTFNKPYSVPPIVILTPVANVYAAQAVSINQVYVTTTTTGFTINFNTAFSPLYSMYFNYMVIETQ